MGIGHPVSFREYRLPLALPINPTQMMIVCEMVQNTVSRPKRTKRRVQRAESEML